ncbi:MAG: hypothetical protein QXU73_05030 [Thermoplasmata archaeon]
MSESEAQALPPKYSRKHLEMHLDKIREVFWKAARQDGISGYSPENLRRFDDVLSDFRPTFAELGCPDPDLATLWGAYAGVGSYFGDVLVNNLGGRWRYPNQLVTILGLIFERPDWIYRHWYVAVGRRKVPVFIIAMRRHTLGREKASLVKAYEEIAEAVGGR